MMQASQYGPFEVTPNDYDPSFEFPGIEEEGEICDQPPAKPSPAVASTSFLRLVVVESVILPSKHRLAVLTGYPEVQLGRDKPVAGAVLPRIRLREMEVSKLHATAYWDGSKREWGLVDMGSVHGTFWKPAGASSSKVRLSASRVASLPQSLNHLDHITIGSTTFEVHIHQDDLPCELCASTGHDIPLLHPSTTEKSSGCAGKQDVLAPKTDPRKSLALLKSSLLHQHSRSSSPSSTRTNYVDRADQRRRMYGSRSGSPSPNPQPIPSQRHQQPLAPPPLPRPVISAPAQPVPSSNVGHGLLTRMGWEPGTTLGLPSSDTDGNHLLEPIQVKCTTDRAGLGATEVASTSSSDTVVALEIYSFMPGNKANCLRVAHSRSRLSSRSSRRVVAVGCLRTVTWAGVESRERSRVAAQVSCLTASLLSNSVLSFSFFPPNAFLPQRRTASQRGKADENAMSRHIRQGSTSSITGRFAGKEVAQKTTNAVRRALGEVTMAAVNRHKDVGGKSGKEKEEVGLKRGRSDSTSVVTTTKSSIARVHRHLPASDAPALLEKRFQIINLWRPINVPALEWPLGLCDYRSVNPEKDALPVALVYPDREGETYGITYNPNHKWKYLRGMTPEEVVLIKCFDSVQDGSVAVFTPHTGFSDPTTPPDAPHRESIELRALVFYD
ncbi:hypothetical protein NMY22_g13432 [Coprinellus aureogranulatus]|nr:hypothetical protein NMY22_g13432 [Coprinellus aureogranulatus]